MLKFDDESKIIFLNY